LGGNKSILFISQKDNHGINSSSHRMGLSDLRQFPSNLESEVMDAFSEYAESSSFSFSS